MSTPYTLTVTVAGLCLAAADEQATSNDNLLHVLMMRYDPQNQNNMQHFARLLFDADYLTGVDSGTQTLTCVDLYNGALDLDVGPTAIDFQASPPTGIANLSTLASVATLDPTYVTGNSNHIANARLTLRKGAFGVQGKTAKFDTTAGPQDLSHYMVWTMTGGMTKDQNANKQDCLTLTFQQMESDKNDPPAPAAIQLCPKGGQINLYFMNAMPMEIPSTDVPADPQSTWNPGDEAMHFDGYFSAFPGTPMAIIQKSTPKLQNKTDLPGDSPLAGWKGGCVFLTRSSGAKLFDVPSPFIGDNEETILTPVCIHAIVDVGVTNPKPPSPSLLESAGHSSHQGHGSPAM